MERFISIVEPSQDGQERERLFLPDPHQSFIYCHAPHLLNECSLPGMIHSNDEDWAQTTTVETVRSSLAVKPTYSTSIWSVSDWVLNHRTNCPSLRHLN